jgi:predicted RND superfamily exporter protein
VVVLVGLERPYGTVFDPVFLDRVKEYSKALETIDFVGDVNSIMSTQYITADGDTIVVTDLVPADFSGSAEEIAELKARIASWDLFQGSIISDDLSATQIIINLDVSTEESTSLEMNASLRKIRSTAQEMFAGLAEVYITGQPIINMVNDESMIADLTALIPLVLLVFLAVLFFSFRRLTFVVLPFIGVVIAVVWTIGSATLFGIKLSTLTTILPVIIVAMGSAYGIHIISHYIDDTRNRVMSVEDHRELVLTLTGRLIKPLFFAVATTFVGLISFCFTPIIPLREFGTFASIGIISSFIILVTLIPSILLIRGPRTSKTKNDKESGSEDKFNTAVCDIFFQISKKKVLVLITTTVIFFVSLYGISNLVIDNVLIEFFQNETDISRSDRFIRRYFGGSKELTLVVEADSPEILLSPGVLGAVDGLSRYLTERVPAVGKVTGFTDIIKRINQVFNVDESPDGLRPVSIIANGANDLGLADFGFGGAGIDDAVTNSGDTTSILEEYPASSGPGGFISADKINFRGFERYSSTDIITLLSNAAGKSVDMSGGALVREIKRLTNFDGAAYYEIPAEPERYGKTTPEELQQIVSNYLVLLAGGDDSGLSNDPFEPTAIKTTIQLRTTGNNDTQEVIDIINTYIEAHFPKNIRILVGGGATIEAAITGLVLGSQVITLIISIVSVFLLVTLAHKSFIAGLIGIVPLIIAVLCNFAVMSFLNIKLNIGTALIASLVMGIGIDYTIHFIDFFKRKYISTGNGDFLRETFLGCGKAIIINAVSVAAGFAILAFSQFKILAEFGLLIALSMVITALVSLIVIPVMLTTIKPKFIYGNIK